MTDKDVAEDGGAEAENADREGATAQPLASFGQSLGDSGARASRAVPGDADLRRNPDTR